ncbi:MAG: BCCT family transporter [Hydrogenophaga sp.]|uniref:BCCT family transporter n=1 Tax=Hydrogenophaga sp. TaxID=1904254 RepID=UPI001DC77684|nr:BCCT family transporter [Hydrogenophaga sp.]MBX3608805.1 BCCT family transporter [Hydrogenophaga sp.]
MELMISAGLILAIVLWGVIAPASLGSAFDTALSVITRDFGWFYLWVVLGLVVMALVLAVSRYGDLKLGGEDEEPEFSLGAWFAMLFAAGMGIGLVFWGVAEPISHYGAPPPGIAPHTPEAAHAAMRYSFFHWGLHPWAVYSVVALAIAFFQFRKGGSALVSTAVQSLPWRFAKGLAPMVNVLAVIATAFGVAASLGMGALQINSGLAAVAGVPVGEASQVAIIVVTTVLFLASAITGVARGIKWLSTFNLIVAALLALAVFVLGPTVAIIDTFTTTLGNYASEFVRMSLRMTPFRDSGWVGGWTVFYWAWWVSWSPFVGLFIARVSRGRSIREFIVGTVLAPTLAAFVWFSVFGGTALNLEIMRNVPIAEAVSADVSTALFALFDVLPMSALLAGVATVLVLVFFVTSGDSAVLVLGMMSTQGNQNPPPRVKIVWGVLVAGIAISLLLAGGLKAVQTATIVFALPFTVVIVLMAVALWRGVREDWNEEQRQERAVRRRMRTLTQGDAPTGHGHGALTGAQSAER